MNKYSKYIIVAVVLAIIVLLVVFRNKISGLFSSTAPAAPPVTGGSGGSNAGPTLNYNKVLKQGVSGEEVKLLQHFLGVTTDGAFGPQTEAALYAQKGVIQTTLAEYPFLPDAGMEVQDQNPGVFDSQYYTDTQGGFLSNILSNVINWNP